MMSSRKMDLPSKHLHITVSFESEIIRTVEYVNEKHTKSTARCIKLYITTKMSYSNTSFKELFYQKL